MDSSDFINSQNELERNHFMQHNLQKKTFFRQKIKRRQILKIIFISYAEMCSISVSAKLTTENLCLKIISTNSMQQKIK